MGRCGEKGIEKIAERLHVMEAERTRETYRKDCMRKYIVSFGGIVRGTNRHQTSYSITRNYTAEVHRLFESAKPFGMEGLFYDDKWLLSSDYTKNASTSEILNQDSYGWLMKPVVLKDALGKIDDGDFLLWADSNHVVHFPDPIIDATVNHPLGIYAKDHLQQYHNIQWTTRRMLTNMDCDHPRYWYSKHLHVNVSAYIKNDFTVRFVDEWAKYATDYETMIKNDLLNYPDFKESRHEQSIFSLLIEKYQVQYYPAINEALIEERMGINV